MYIQLLLYVTVVVLPGYCHNIAFWHRHVYISVNFLLNDIVGNWAHSPVQTIWESVYQRVGRLSMEG